MRFFNRFSPTFSLKDFLNFIERSCDVANYGYGVSSTFQTIISPFQNYNWFNTATDVVTAVSPPFIFASFVISILRSERLAKQERLLDILSKRMAEQLNLDATDKRVLDKFIQQLKILVIEGNDNVSVNLPSINSASERTDLLENQGMINQENLKNRIRRIIAENNEIKALFKRLSEKKLPSKTEKIYIEFSAASYVYSMMMIAIAQAIQDWFTYVEGHSGDASVTIEQGILYDMLPAFIVATSMAIYGFAPENTREKAIRKLNDIHVSVCQHIRDHAHAYFATIYSGVGKAAIIGVNFASIGYKAFLDFLYNASTWATVAYAIRIGANLTLTAPEAIAMWGSVVLVSGAETALEQITKDNPRTTKQKIINKSAYIFEFTNNLFSAISLVYLAYLQLTTPSENSTDNNKKVGDGVAYFFFASWLFCQAMQIVYSTYRALVPFSERYFREDDNTLNEPLPEHYYINYDNSDDEEGQQNHEDQNSSNIPPPTFSN